MTKVNARNERKKRAFFKYLKNADGCCDSTINNIESAILLWQEFFKDEDFALFNADKAMAFKQWLAKRVCRGKPIALVTYHSYLRYLRKFFVWLVRETGYRSRIKPNAVDYLKVTEREARVATQSMPRNYPSLTYVKQLVNSIEIDNEIARRDQGLISFTLLSGMRDKAIATLPLGCFDEETLTIVQNPRQGVDTKFAKLIPTTLFRFDEEMLRIVIEWARHLRSKGFGTQDPLFPRSRLEKGQDGLTFEAANEVEPVFWQGTGRIREIFKKRSQEAGLPYFQPHTFRHLAINLAFKACTNGEEFKAISQNVGHEHIATTLATYGNYPSSRLAEIITNMDFSGRHAPSLNEQFEELKKLIESQKR